MVDSGTEGLYISSCCQWWVFTFWDGSIHIGKWVTNAKMEVVKTEKIYNYFHLQTSFNWSINMCLILGVESCWFTDFTNEEQMKYLILLPYIPAFHVTNTKTIQEKQKTNKKHSGHKLAAPTVMFSWLLIIYFLMNNSRNQVENCCVCLCIPFLSVEPTGCGLFTSIPL